MTDDDSHGPPVRSEEDILHGRRILIYLAAAIVIIVVFSAISWRVQLGFEHGERPSGDFSERELRPPEVVNGLEQTLIEQIDVAAESAAAQRAILESYGWVDRDRGVIRIPIERAIELFAPEPR